MPKYIIKILCSVLIFCLLVPHQGLGNTDAVRNVEVLTDGAVIEIRYDLVPENANRKHTVSIQISDNGGRTYNVTPYFITGDIGRNILPGRNKRIVWLVEREFPADIDLDRYDFRFTAKPQGLSRNTLYAMLGAAVAGVGTVALLIFGGGGDDGFPDPPGRPE